MAVTWGRPPLGAAHLPRSHSPLSNAPGSPRRSGASRSSSSRCARLSLRRTVSAVAVNLAPVGCGGAAANEPLRGQTVDQAHSAVGLDGQPLGQHADGEGLIAAMALDREQRLVLLRRQACLLRRRTVGSRVQARGCARAAAQTARDLAQQPLAERGDCVHVLQHRLPEPGQVGKAIAPMQGPAGLHARILRTQLAAEAPSLRSGRPEVSSPPTGK